MSRRSAVSLGDLVRAVRTLRVRDEAEMADIARVLGMVDASTPRISAGNRGTPVAPGAAGPPAGSTAVAGPHQTVAGPAVHRAETVATEDLADAAEIDLLPPESSLRRAPRATPALETLLVGPAAPVEVQDTALFVSPWQRGIVTSVISTEMPGGAIDVPRVVDQIASGRAVNRLPRLNVHTTRKGLQVLLNIGEGMRPFADDSAKLERLLRLTAGDDSVDLLRFDRTLADGAGSGTRRTWKPYRAPAPGTPVLVLSDFDLAGAVDGAMARLAWEPLARAAATAGCPLLALTPFPPDRWPAWLEEMFTVLQWDRSTNATIARRAAVAASRRVR